MAAENVSSATVSTVTQGTTLIFALAASGKRRQLGQFWAQSVLGGRGQGMFTRTVYSSLYAGLHTIAVGRMNGRCSF